MIPHPTIPYCMILNPTIPYYIVPGKPAATAFGTPFVEDVGLPWGRVAHHVAYLGVNRSGLATPCISRDCHDDAARQARERERERERERAREKVRERERYVCIYIYRERERDTHTHTHTHARTHR